MWVLQYMLLWLKMITWLGLSYVTTWYWAVQENGQFAQWLHYSDLASTNNWLQFKSDHHAFGKPKKPNENLRMHRRTFQVVKLRHESSPATLKTRVDSSWVSSFDVFQLKKSHVTSSTSQDNRLLQVWVFKKRTNLSSISKTRHDKRS